MRVYGTSPLFNYVELIFRCKRMFIVAVILGTVITTTVVQTRATNYDAKLFIALSGNPEIQLIGSNNQQDQVRITPSGRKANRLNTWIQRLPSFLESVVKNAQLDKAHPEKSVEDLAKDIRKKLTMPELINDQFLEISITWPKADEAENIMKELFSRFYDETYIAETAASSGRREVLQKQFDQANIKWAKIAQERVRYKEKHWYESPDLLGTMIGTHEDSIRQLDGIKLDISEAEVRLKDLTRQLAETPKEIDNGTETQVDTFDPSLSIQADLETLKKDRETLVARYSATHPKVVAVDTKIAAKQKELEDAKKTKPTSTPKSSIVRRMANPAWAELQHDKLEIERNKHALERRCADLQLQINKATVNLQAMPKQEVEYAKIERDYVAADSNRRYLDAELLNAKQESEKAQITQSQQIKKLYEPKAEPADTNGKIAALYAVGPIMGLFLAFLFSLAAEALDHTLRTPVEVEKYLNKPVLAVIPQMSLPKTSRRALAEMDSRRALPPKRTDEAEPQT